MASRSRFETWAQARRHISELVERVNADPALARAAAANPLLALEELGYEIAPDMRAEFEDRIRFGEDVAEERATLRKEIFRHAGRSFDLDSPDELDELLHSELRIGQSARKREAAPLSVEELPVKPFEYAKKSDSESDPLTRYAGEHPIIQPLLRYRQIDAEEPKLASRSTFDRVRAEDAQMPSLRVTFRLRGGRK